MQRPFELAGDGIGRADGEVLEAMGLPQIEGGTGRVAEVLVGQLLHVVLRRAPLPQTPRVVVARELVDQLRPLHEPAELEDEQPCPLPVGQQDADRLVLLHHRLELPDGRHVVDDHLGVDRHRQLDDLPQVRGGAREDR